MAANPYRVGAIIGRGSGKLEEAQTIAAAVQPLLIADVSCRLVVTDQCSHPNQSKCSHLLKILHERPDNCASCPDRGPANGGAVTGECLLPKNVLLGVSSR